jgi:hypothetical protein
MKQILILVVSILILFLQQTPAVAQQDFNRNETRFGSVESLPNRQFQRYEHMDSLMAWSADTTWQLKPSDVVDMIEWLSQHVTVATSKDMIVSSIPKYNRLQHFAGWIKQYKGDCHDTRAAVLIRASIDPSKIVYSEKNKCRVEAGVWDEPYAGEELTETKELQIDHVVPLHHAYYAGAANWTHNKRCHYANFLDNDFHLLAVSGHENMSKGDRGPEEYMPPNIGFRCTYMRSWLKVKTIWQMAASQAEVDSIREQMKEDHCATTDETITAHELAEQRADAEVVVDRCPND